MLRVTIDGFVGSCKHLRSLKSSGRFLHCLDDILIAGATAEVAGDAFPDLFLTRTRVLAQQLMDGEDHSRRAKTALQGVMLDKSLLDGMEGVAWGEALNSRDFCSGGIHR